MRTSEAILARLACSPEEMQSLANELEAVQAEARRLGVLMALLRRPRSVPETREAMLAGYDGSPCPSCGRLTMVRGGGRAVCDSCGLGTPPPGADGAANAPPPVPAPPPPAPKNEPAVATGEQDGGIAAAAIRAGALTHVLAHGPATARDLAAFLGVKAKGSTGAVMRVRNALKTPCGLVARDGRYHLAGAAAEAATPEAGGVGDAGGAAAIRRSCARMLHADGPQGRQGLSQGAGCTVPALAAALVMPWFCVDDGEYHLTERGRLDWLAAAGEVLK